MLVHSLLLLCLSPSLPSRLNLSALSRCVPAVTAPQRRQQRWRRIRQTWTSVMQRWGTWAASTGQERNPPTLLSFPAKALLLDATHRHNKLDNKIMRTLRVTFITHQPLDVHKWEEGPTFFELPLGPLHRTLRRCLAVIYESSQLWCHDKKLNKMVKTCVECEIHKGHWISI